MWRIVNEIYRRKTARENLQYRRSRQTARFRWPKIQSNGLSNEITRVHDRRNISPRPFLPPLDTIRYRVHIVCNITSTPLLFRPWSTCPLAWSAFTFLSVMWLSPHNTSKPFPLFTITRLIHYRNQAGTTHVVYTQYSLYIIDYLHYDYILIDCSQSVSILYALVYDPLSAAQLQYRASLSVWTAAVHHWPLYTRKIYAFRTPPPPPPLNLPIVRSRPLIVTVRLLTLLPQFICRSFFIEYDM